MDAKARAAASIASAREELDRALAEIDAIRAFDPAVVGLVAHALSSYITVTAATAEMLRLTLVDHPDKDVPVWLEGISHAAHLMQHSVSRFVSTSAPADFPLQLDSVNLYVLMERACQYFRPRAAAREIRIGCRAVGDVPQVWADRVALAVVAENLLSNALRMSAQNGTVQVDVSSEEGYVICTVRNEGPRLTQDELLTESPRTPSQNGPLDEISIAREFVQRMDGELWCDSDPRHGTWCAFRLLALGGTS
jgi:signal transduction histidine kinase